MKLDAHSAVFAALCAAPVLAGPIVPPAGPVSSSYKTLTQIEPRTIINAANTPGDADSTFRIAQSGSYYLTGNVTGAAGKIGIEVAANNVTIDLNGFTLQGVPGSLHGIAPTIVGSGLAVSNGHVTGWGDIGVAAIWGFAPIFELHGSRFENLTVTSCQTGIRAGDGGLVKNCVVRSCVSTGMIGGKGSVFESCASVANGSNGYVGLEGCLFTACTAQGNTGIGFDVSSQGDCIITGCSATRNTSGGIKTGQQSFVTNCQIAQNGTFGVQIEPNSVIEGCQIVRNTGSGVTTPPLAFSGLLVVRGCFISANSGWGIDFSLVVGGSAYQNFLEGNTFGAIDNDGNDDTPISATTAGAGPWDNIGF